VYACALEGEVSGFHCLVETSCIREQSDGGGLDSHQTCTFRKKPSASDRASRRFGNDGRRVPGCQRLQSSCDQNPARRRRVAGELGIDPGQKLAAMLDTVRSLQRQLDLVGEQLHLHIRLLATEPPDAFVGHLPRVVAAARGSTKAPAKSKRA